jgi:hypothetical protein
MSLRLKRQLGGFAFVCALCLLTASAIRHLLIEPALMNQQCLTAGLSSGFACTLRYLAITFINLPLLPYLPLALLALTLKWPSVTAILVATAIASFGLILYRPEPSALAIILAGFILVRESSSASNPGTDMKNQNANKVSA